MKKGTLNKEGLKSGIWWPKLEIYQSNESERDPPDWTTAKRTWWRQILNSNVQGTLHNHHSFIYVLRVLRALTEE